MPLAAVPRFVDDVSGVVTEVAPGATTVLWGHLGDGNVHVNVVGAQDASDAVEERVLHLAAGLGGTVSAEHGVGISKAKHLGLVRSDTELELLRTLKDAIDPAGRLNPGVVFAALPSTV